MMELVRENMKNLQFKAAEDFLRKRGKGQNKDFTLKDVLDFIRERDSWEELSVTEVAAMFRRITFSEQRNG